MPHETLDATVVIPSYNNKQTLLPCIKHLARQTHPRDRWEVVVVLDGSTDGSAEALRALDLPITLRVVEHHPNRGRPAAINRGAAEARGELIILTDGDCLVNPEFVAAHVRGHARGDVVIGPIPLSDASPISFLTDGVKEWAEEHAKKMLERPKDLDLTEIYGANWSARLQVFKDIGGQREDLLRGADSAMGKAFLERGLKIVFEPEAIAAQIYDKTIPGYCRDFYLDGKNHVPIVRESPEARASLLIGEYYPLTLAKRLVRPLIVRRNPLGNLIVSVMETLLEAARQRGLRWKVLAAGQGFLGNCLYFRGMFDAVGQDWPAFEALVLPR